MRPAMVCVELGGERLPAEYISIVREKRGNQELNQISIQSCKSQFVRRSERAHYTIPVIREKMFSFPFAEIENRNMIYRILKRLKTFGAIFSQDRELMN